MGYIFYCNVGMVVTDFLDNGQYPCETSHIVISERDLQYLQIGRRLN